MSEGAALQRTSMHRLAIFSDVYANLHALTPVLANIDSRNIDSVYCRCIHIPTPMGTMTSASESIFRCSTCQAHSEETERKAIC